MSDLIDKSEVLKKLCAACSNVGSFACISCVIPKIVKDTQTIEAEPVRHGRWIEGTSRGSFSIYCSYCGSYKETICPTDYCPACGARMDGDADKEL